MSDLPGTPVRSATSTRGVHHFEDQRGKSAALRFAGAITPELPAGQARVIDLSCDLSTAQLGELFDGTGLDGIVLRTGTGNKLVVGRGLGDEVFPGDTVRLDSSVEGVVRTHVRGTDGGVTIMLTVLGAMLGLGAGAGIGYALGHQVDAQRDTREDVQAERARLTREALLLTPHLQKGARGACTLPEPILDSDAGWRLRRF